MPDDPLLFAGFNADPINRDETDGAGTNAPVWPVLFNTYIGLAPLVITEELLAAFDECEDLVIPAENDTITFPAEVDEVVFRKAG